MKLTEIQFCKMVHEFTGEPLDNIKQLEKWVFTGEELKKFIEHCINFNLDNEKLKEPLKCFMEFDESNCNCDLKHCKKYGR